jgi:DegV family protein with EDD domain
MIRIVTDSSCDLPDDVIAQYRIEIVPLTIRFGEEELVDREELTSADFWHRLTTGNVLPETAAPSVGRFQQAFSRLVSAGADGIVVLCISSKISATIQSATLAADQFTAGVPVRVIDSTVVSGALGLAAMEAAKAASAGRSLDEVETTARDACERARIFATPDTLEYLRRGGRIGGAAALIGGLLDVKALIGFEDGKVAGVGRVRTRKRSLASIIEHVAEHAASVTHLAVVHSDPPDLADFLRDLAGVYSEEPLLCRFGPVVGTHIGPAALGVTYLVR